MRAALGDGFGTPDQGASFLFMVAAFASGWVGVRRLRGKGFPGLPRTWAWVAAGSCVTFLVLAVVIPPIIRPAPRSIRPSTDARIEVLAPSNGSVFRGNPATVPVRLKLIGARIVRRTSTRLVRDEGHVHLYLDGALVSMQYGLSSVLHVAPGSHVLTAEFVALDHGPFLPREIASAAFTVAA